MNLYDVVKLVVIVALCLGVIAGVVAFSQASSLVGGGLTGLVNNAQYVQPYGVPQHAASWALEAFADILLPLKTFVTFLVSIALLIGAWRVLKLIAGSA